jgi:hypothetical protein
MASAERIDIVLNLVWKDQQKLASVLSSLDRITHATSLLKSGLHGLTSGFRALGHQLVRAASFYITFRIFSAIYRAVDALTNAIPDLIRRGEEWAAVLDDIQDATGMTAEQTSKLAGVAKIVGINVEGLGRQFSLFSRAIIENEENVAKYGIRVRDANGDLRSSWEIFQSVRNAVSTYGKQLLSTSAVQTAFGRSGYQMLDLLQLSQSQFHRLAMEAKRAGLWMTQAGIDGAEAWQRTRNQLDATITGLGSQILGGVAPVLSALVASIAGAIQKNMKQIVDFVSSVVVWIAGAISGFFGLEFKWKTVNAAMVDSVTGMSDATRAQKMLGRATEDTADATDRQTNAIERQIKAIDRQLDKLDRAEDRRRARREHKDLLNDINDAKRELSALRNETIYFGGMSAVEAELARQAQAADIIDAEKALADAKDALRVWEREQETQNERERLQNLRDALQERLSAMQDAVKKAVGTMKRGFQALPRIVDDVGDSVLKLSDKLKGVFSEGMGQGGNFAKLLRSIQTGLQELQGFLQGLQGVLQTIQSFFQKTLDPILRGLEPILRKIAEILGIDLNPQPGRVGARSDLGLVLEAKPQRKPVTQQVTDDIVDALRAPARGLGLWRDETAARAERNVAEARARQEAQRRENERQAADAWRLRRSEMGMPLADTRPGRGGDPRDFGYDPTRGTPRSMSPGRFNSLFGGGGGGASGGAGGGNLRAGASGIGGLVIEQEKIMRRYFGRNSEHAKNQREGNAELGSVVGNTDPLVSGEVGTRVNRWQAGELGVGNSKFGDIGQVRGWSAGELGVGNAKFGDIGRVNAWGAGELGTRVNNTVGTTVGNTVAATIGNKVNTALNEWGVGRIPTTTDIPRTVDTNAIGRTSVAIDGFGLGGRLPTRTAVEQVDIGSMPTRMVGWATRAEANVNMTEIQPSAAEVFARSIAGRLGGRAMGGPVLGRIPVMVGERGPEVFVPDASGTVYNAGDTRKLMSSSAYTSPRMSGGPMNISIQLDPYTTRLLLSGRAANTSTRAGVGV